MPKRVLVALSLALFSLTAVAQDAPGLQLDGLEDGPVYHVPLNGMVDNALASYIDRAVSDATENGASLILFEVDTFGGLVDAADAIRSTILDAPMPTVAFINKNAASAGALISYANDVIVMAPGSTMGAAAVVDATGEYASEKYQSYMRGHMRTTAEANGRDPSIAAAMVDDSLSIPGVVAAGELLTLTASEALDLSVADAILTTSDEVLSALGVAARPVVEHSASGLERLLRFLGSPIVASILMLMMMGGLYFELQTPGVGFPGLMAFLGASMFFAPHYMLGLADSIEIILFIVGVLLLLVEVFVLPGFGVAGILGLILTIGSLLAALIGNVGFAFPGGGAIARASATLGATFLLLIVLAASLARYLPKSRRFSRLVLAPDLASSDGYTSAESDTTLVGMKGKTVTPLRPSGVADIDQKRVDVIAQGTFIDVDVEIEVVDVRGSRVEVRPAS